MLDLACSAHPYYLRALAARGLQRDAFRSLSDIELIPPIDKDVLAAECETFTLDAAALPDATLEERIVWQLIHTTGTTRRPTPFVD